MTLRSGEILLGLWVLALPCIAFFWVVSCNSGVGVKCIFWKATSSQLLYFGFLRLIQDVFMFSCLVFGKWFSMWYILWIFKILVNALGFAMVLA